MVLTRHYNKELLEYPNCAALSGTGKCRWLTLPKCQGSNCTFFKTEDCICLESQRILERIAALNEEIQLHISKKYYKGFRPWNIK